MSSNRADPTVTKPWDLGPCRCPVEPRPHERDSADVVRQFGYGDRGKIRQAGRLGGPEALRQMAILLGVKRWTLVKPDGTARPITAEEIALLDEATVNQLTDEALDEAFADAPLPNGSGAPSPDGSQASAGPTPTTPEQPTSTST